MFLTQCWHQGIGAKTLVGVTVKIQVRHTKHLQIWRKIQIGIVFIFSQLKNGRYTIYKKNKAHRETKTTHFNFQRTPPFKVQICWQDARVRCHRGKIHKIPFFRILIFGSPMMPLDRGITSQTTEDLDWKTKTSWPKTFSMESFCQTNVAHVKRCNRNPNTNNSKIFSIASTDPLKNMFLFRRWFYKSVWFI